MSFQNVSSSVGQQFFSCSMIHGKLLFPNIFGTINQSCVSCQVYPPPTHTHLCMLKSRLKTLFMKTWHKFTFINVFSFFCTHFPWFQTAGYIHRHQQRKFIPTGNRKEDIVGHLRNNSMFIKDTV